jgi:AbrB family looped-hinge helix DNA binding protein
MHTQVTIASNGRLTVPASARHQLGLHGGEKLNMRVVDGALVFETSSATMTRIRAMMQQYIDPNVSVVDELIAERRAEAANE